MALIHNYLTPHGVTASYHRIVKADIDIQSGTIQVALAVYASPEARAAGGVPLWHEYEAIPFTALTQDPRDLLYPMLAAFGAGKFRGAGGDAEGFNEPGNFSISLTPEAMLPPPPPAEESEDEEAPSGPMLAPETP